MRHHLHPNSPRRTATGSSPIDNPFHIVYLRYTSPPKHYSSAVCRRHCHPGTILETRYCDPTSRSSFLCTAALFSSMETTSKHPQNRSHLIHPSPTYTPCTTALSEHPNSMETSHLLSWPPIRPQTTFHQTSYQRDSYGQRHPGEAVSSTRT